MSGDVRLPVFDRRRTGVLLHLTSLGADALGAPARNFIDWLVDSGCSVWQVLPVGPTEVDGSPYWTRSDCAGNTHLLGANDLARRDDADFERFRAEAADWLDDYTLFAAISEAQQGRSWHEWPAPLRDRESAALVAARRVYGARIESLAREQHAFDVAWRELRLYARERGIRLFGDVPIYVSPDSVETWAHREEFQLDATGRPAFVSGVPPDYFSDKGQLWGNPLYDWARAERTDFAFWRRRIARQLARYDLLRIDHFRGLAAHWAVPAGAPDARGGQWMPTPGRALLEKLRVDFPDLPIVAEDLGLITPDVHELRDGFGLPGMRVLQFAFDGDPGNVHLPFNYPQATCAYTGTHDNDTTRGWFASLDAETLQRVSFYLGGTLLGEHRERAVDAMMRAVLGSVAQLAVLPMQDLLGLGSEARLNTPGTVTGNWSWRVAPEALSVSLARDVRWLNQAFGRMPT